MKLGRSNKQQRTRGRKPEICEKHRISPSSVSKWMTGKVKGYGPQLGGARRGKILSEGMFKQHRGLLQYTYVQATWRCSTVHVHIDLSYICRSRCCLIFLPADETALATTIKDFQLSGFPLTISRVYQLAFQYAKINGITGFSDESQTAGRKWLSGFLKCNPGVCVRKAQNLSIAHAMGANPTVIGNWFKLLAEVKQKCQITSPSQI